MTCGLALINTIAQRCPSWRSNSTSRRQDLANAYPGVEAFRKALDCVIKTEEIGEIERFVDAFALAEVRQVVEHAAAVNHAVARQQGDVLSQPIRIDLIDVIPVDAHAAAFRPQ